MENSKAAVLPVILKGGDNYLLWSRTAKAVLSGRGLWSQVEDNPKAQDVSKEGEEETLALAAETKRIQEDQAVLAILQSSLEVTILEAYSYCETARELWNTLRNVFGNVSNLTRVFEIKKKINTLNQGDLEFNSFFGKFRSLWAELEMLRPATVDPATLNERREQDKVFALLMVLNPCFNDLIKHLLRAEKLPSLEEVCAQIQKEQGSLGLFSGRSELPTANKGVYRPDERKYGGCDHCKRRGHHKNQCWILHPHLRPSSNPRFNGSNRDHHSARGNYPSEGTHGQGQMRGRTQESAMAAHGQGQAIATTSQDDVVRKSDLEALIKSIASLKESGTSLFSQKSNRTLVVDSGASHHMISNPDLLENIKPAIGEVVIANGDKIAINGIGSLRLFNKKSKAFYMPKFTSNLLSVKKATSDLNCYAIFGPNNVHFQDIETMSLLGKGGVKDELYVLEDTPLASSNLSCSKLCFSASSSLWHDRLGHPHSRALELLIPDMSFDNSGCEACILGKHCKVVFPKSCTIYEKCFELVHSDVWTSPCVSRDNNKYFVTFIDEKSKYTWLTLLPSKDRVFDAFLNFQNYVTNHFNAKLKIFRSDNGGEYTSQKFREHFSKHGILHQTSCPYNPQQNGVAERKNRHLMEVARSLMFHKNVPRRFWGDAVMTACYLINRIPTKVLKDISPFEVLNHSKPSLDHLRTFGCLAFVLVPGELRNKLEAKSIKCVFIGYSSTQKGYKCYDPINQRMHVSRDVKFLEYQGYFDKKDWDSLKDMPTSTSDRAASLRFLLEHLGRPVPNVPQPDERASTNRPSDDQPSHSQDTDLSSPNATSDMDGANASQDEEEQISVEEDHMEDQPILRRSTRIRHAPSNWINTRVYYNNLAVAHPPHLTCSFDLLPSDHVAFLGKIEAQVIPYTYEEAKESKEWAEAIDAEIGAMEKNQTWVEAVLPHGKKAVSSKWVFTIKHKSNGDIERYKARLVARGFTQTYGEDYLDTFAPVAKLPTVRVILAIATNLSWGLWQMDVKNAFLQGELEDEVYMTPPPGLEHSVTQGKVLRLRKAIYGLKQSPRAWYHKLSQTLRDHDFRRSEADHTLFTRRTPLGIVVVLIYVDDLIISGSDKEGISSTKSFLKSIFDIKDLGELKYFLGIEVCRSNEGLFLSQRKYMLDLLHETGFSDCILAKTPLTEDYKPKREGENDYEAEQEPFEDQGLYRKIVGKLIYLTLTRPDLCFSVNQISQHMKAPTKRHWKMAERILRYVKGTIDQGIWMSKNESTEIVGYCDADWAGDREDRRSTTGYCTFIGGNLVTWKTKKQKVVACSSAEAEYRAMRKLTNELTWLKALLKDIDIEQATPMTMHCDNQAAIHIATNSVFHERTKHIEIDCHKVRQKIEEGVILPCYTKSEDQLADIFTKAASLKVCSQIHGKLGLVSPSLA